LRFGLVTVDCLKKAEGHFVSMHFKDLNAAKQDVPHGTGINDAAEQLAEIERQGFTGVISIEYAVWDDQQHNNLVKCVEFFNREAAKLVK
jgi:sugar phosphate isomerase/epimerase